MTLISETIDLTPVIISRLPINTCFFIHPFGGAGYVGVKQEDMTGNSGGAGTTQYSGFKTIIGAPSNPGWVGFRNDFSTPIVASKYTHLYLKVKLNFQGKQWIIFHWYNSLTSARLLPNAGIVNTSDIFLINQWTYKNYAIGWGTVNTWLSYAFSIRQNTSFEVEYAALGPSPTILSNLLKQQTNYTLPFEIKMKLDRPTSVISNVRLRQLSISSTHFQVDQLPILPKVFLSLDMCFPSLFDKSYVNQSSSSTNIDPQYCVVPRQFYNGFMFHVLPDYSLGYIRSMDKTIKMVIVLSFRYETPSNEDLLELTTTYTLPRITLCLEIDELNQ